jgi:hypothetical protein
MSWIPQISSGYFALAGLICAAGPVLIHLLNRRRFRVVEWAAMEFLLDAISQRRRRVRLRDIILLLLRTAAVLLFGLALARPYLASGGALLDANRPRHLVLLIDNSLSMGYRSVDTTRLQQAQRQAAALVESLPDGSSSTIVATCGDASGLRGPFRRKSDALEQLADIALADGTSRQEDVFALVQATRGSAAPLADQFVYFTDLQQSDWSAKTAASARDEPAGLHVCDLSDGAWENTWVSDVRLNDDVVNLDTPATVFVGIHHHGETLRRTEVSLFVGERLAATRSVELPPGTTQRQLSFECSFAEAPVEPGDVTFIPVRATVNPDRLEEDNHRSVMVPVVTSLPVVFVDQYASEEEDARLGRLGETRPLRQLLAPQTASAARPLIEVRHVHASGLNRNLLATARLVVVAGIPDPARIADDLLQYAEQGGPLVIAAGGSFDPVAWNGTASLPAAKLLPGALASQYWGTEPDESDSLLEPFTLAVDSIELDPLICLPGIPDDQMRDLLLEPLFFKSVVFNPKLTGRGDAAPATRDGDQPVQSSTNLPAGTASRWLSWAPQIPADDSIVDNGASSFETLPPRVLARFNNDAASPFLVQHHVGRGTVLFCSTSLLPTWNNVAQTNAMALWDHLLRTLIRSTLPQRNFQPQDQLAFPVPKRSLGLAVELQRPDTSLPPEWIDVGFIQRNQRGVTIRDAWSRGLYRLVSENTPQSSTSFAEENWRAEIAVNGNASESDLSPLSASEIRSRIVDSGVGQLFTGDSLGAIGSATQGSALWWWLILLVGVLLCGELVILFLSGRVRTARGTH